MSIRAFASFYCLHCKHCDIVPKALGYTLNIFCSFNEFKEVLVKVLERISLVKRLYVNTFLIFIIFNFE